MPIGLMILFLMGVGPALPWRRATKEKLRKSFIMPVTMGLVVAAVTFALGVREVYPIVTFAFAGFAKSVPAMPASAVLPSHSVALLSKGLP